MPPPTDAPAPSPPPVFTPATPSAPLPQADDTADAPPSTGTVDLNTASLAELNGLGGGMIGKAIIARRPYASPSELLSKRVLSRATYEKIKGQVTVR
ncbi:helix-hairpin-helix domain-containing protein [Methylobacterium sp. MA0201]